MRKASGRRRTHWMFEKGEEQWDGRSKKMEKAKKKDEGRREAKHRKKLQLGRKTKKSSLLGLSSESKIKFLEFEMLVF